jgi:hypothetical protein
MIKSFLENRTCNVQVNHQNSAPIHIHAVLSPILYLVYCSDFPVSDTSRTKTRMFSDDTTLWTCSKKPRVRAEDDPKETSECRALGQLLESKTKPTKIPMHPYDLPRTKTAATTIRRPPHQQPTNPQTKNNPLPRSHLFPQQLPLS